MIEVGYDPFGHFHKACLAVSRVSSRARVTIVREGCRSFGLTVGRLHLVMGLPVHCQKPVYCITQTSSDLINLLIRISDLYKTSENAGPLVTASGE